MVDRCGVAKSVLRDLPDGFSIEAFELTGQFSTLGPRLFEETANLAAALGQAQPPTAAAIELAAKVGERVASAPDANPEAFLAAEWKTASSAPGTLRPR